MEGELAGALREQVECVAYITVAECRESPPAIGGASTARPRATFGTLALVKLADDAGFAPLLVLPELTPGEKDAHVEAAKQALALALSASPARSWKLAFEVDHALHVVPGARKSTDFLLPCCVVRAIVGLLGSHAPAMRAPDPARGCAQPTLVFCAARGHDHAVHCAAARARRARAGRRTHARIRRRVRAARAALGFHFLIFILFYFRLACDDPAVLT